MYGYIYLTTNLINGKKYIGQHRAERFEPEKYTGSGKLILEAFDKYGVENFKCELIEECNSEDELNQKEIYWISYYDAVNSRDFYNLCKGGEGHTCEPWNKGKHGVQEWTESMENAFEKGRHLPASDKLKAELSRTRKAYKGSRWMTNGIKDNQIKKEDIDYYLSIGWIFGHTKIYKNQKHK